MKYGLILIGVVMIAGCSSSDDGVAPPAEDPGTITDQLETVFEAANGKPLEFMAAIGDKIFNGQFIGRYANPLPHKIPCLGGPE